MGRLTRSRATLTLTASGGSSYSSLSTSSIAACLPMYCAATPCPRQGIVGRLIPAAPYILLAFDEDLRPVHIQPLENRLVSRPFNGRRARRQLLLNLCVRESLAPAGAPPRRCNLARQRFHGLAYCLEFFGNFDHDLHLGVSSIVGSSAIPSMAWLCPVLNSPAKLLRSALLSLAAPFLPLRIRTTPLSLSPIQRYTSPILAKVSSRPFWS